MHPPPPPLLCGPALRLSQPYTGLVEGEARGGTAAGGGSAVSSVNAFPPRAILLNPKRERPEANAGQLLLFPVRKEVSHPRAT